MFMAAKACLNENWNFLARPQNPTFKFRRRVLCVCTVPTVEMEHTEISLLLDRHINADLLLWSICPTQDVIACCFTDQIACHRLHWQRLWVYQHKNRNASPTAIVWHPEAKLLGVGLDDGTVILLDPETGSLSREMKVVESAITSLSWLEEERGSGTSPHQKPSVRVALRLLAQLGVIRGTLQYLVLCRWQ